MSIFGIGIDIVDIARMKKSIDQYGDKFAKKILHPDELNVYSERKNKEAYLAKRFAAKEAFVKAMGKGFVKNITLQSIQVVNQDNGKPEILLCSPTREVFEALEATNIFLSISDEKHYAIAQVIIEK